MRVLQSWNAGWQTYAAIRVASVRAESVTVALRESKQNPIRPTESPYFEAAQTICNALRSEEQLEVGSVLALVGYQTYRKYISKHWPEVDLHDQTSRFVETVRHVARQQSADCLVRLSPSTPPRVIDGHHRACIAAVLRLPVSLYVPVYRQKDQSSER